MESSFVLVFRILYSSVSMLVSSTVFHYENILFHANQININLFLQLTNTNLDIQTLCYLLTQGTWCEIFINIYFIWGKMPNFWILFIYAYWQMMRGNVTLLSTWPSACQPRVSRLQLMAAILVLTHLRPLQGQHAEKTLITTGPQVLKSFKCVFQVSW